MLVIECPNGCRLRADESKAGTIVKCPICKSHIQIAPLSEARVETTRSVVQAKIHLNPTPVDRGSKTGEPDKERPLTEGGKRLADDTKQNHFDVDEASSNRPIEEAAEQSSLNENIISGLDPRDPGIDELPAVISIVDKKILPESVDIPDFENTVQKPSWDEIKSRMETSNEDRVLLARLYAGLLCLVGLMNLMPFLVSWFQSVQSGDSFDLTRWMYLQMFLAGLHFIYAVFLLQVPDWSALRTVAVASLCFAVTFGVVATGLVVGENGGQIANFLEVPFELIRRATYWCVVMLVLTTIFCVIAGREAVNWKRTEELMEEIMLKRRNA